MEEFTTLKSVNGEGAGPGVFFVAYTPGKKENAKRGFVAEGIELDFVGGR